MSKNAQTAASSAPPRLLTGPFLLCAAANFLQALAFNLYLHLPGFLRQLGADEIQIGLIFGLTAAVAIGARPPVGHAMDTRGRRIVILTGSVLNVLVCGLYLTVHALGVWIYLVRLAHGLAEATLFAAFFTLAADLIPPSRRTEGLALFGISGMLPISLGGLLGDIILARADYAMLFEVSAGLAAVSLLLAVSLRDRPPAADEGVNRGFFAAVVQGDLLPVWFLGTVFATVVTSYFTFLKTFVLETGIGSIGGFFTTYAVAAALLRLVFAWLPERVGPKRVLFPALGLLGVGLLLLARAQRSTELVVAGVLCGLGHGFIFPILSGMVVARARPTERGAALSIFTALFDAGVLIGGPALGAVIRLAGYPAMFTTAAAVLVAGSVAFAVWDRGGES